MSISSDNLKSLIAYNCEINQHIDDLNAILVSMLKQAMAFFVCDSSSVLFYQTQTSSLLVSLNRSGISQEKHIPVDGSSVASWVMRHQQTVRISDCQSDTRFSQKNIDARLKNLVAVPVMFGDVCFGVIEMFNRTDGQEFSGADMEILKLLGQQAGIYLRNYVRASKEDRIGSLVRDIPADSNGKLDLFVGESPIILEIERTVGDIAKTNTTVLITGEKGSGRKYFAKKLHKMSDRKDLPFVYVKSGNKSQEQLLHEIFGYLDGDAICEGAVSTAQGGFLVFDEIADFSLELQDKILGMIKEKKYSVIGGNSARHCDVRVVAITCRNLDSLVKKGLFLEELYYLLNILPLNIPPLRKHMDDVQPLAELFLEICCRELNKNIEGFTADALESLKRYSWPGNIAELRNVVERSCIVCDSSFIKRNHVGVFTDGSNENGTNFSTEVAEEISSGSDKSLKNALNSFKRQYIKNILVQEKWNQTSAARVLDVQRTYVSKLIAELGIERNN